ncbi:MAG: hypothetical protein WCX94_03465 [Candidatus Dojkabacteria bacterium]
MAIDLTKQRLYSLRLAVPEDNRYPYGAFNAYYSNQVFYASTRLYVKYGNLYHYFYGIDNEETLESNITISEMAWFVAYLYYDENRLLDTELSFMELMTDITNYSKQLSDLPTIPDGYTLKWNIYGVVPYDPFRINNGSYLKDDYVYKVGKNEDYILKANNDNPTTYDWLYVYDITNNQLSYEIESMEDFVYDMLSNPKCQVIGDFIEGDRVVEISEEGIGSYYSDISHSPFLKYSCNKYRIDLSTLIFSEIGNNSNTFMSISSVEDYTTTNLGKLTYIKPIDLDSNGYYDFEIENDGVYIITIIHNGNRLYEDYLFISCGVETCIESLMDSIYCNDLDCCKECNEDMIKDINFKRNELNKLMLFLNVISNTINYAKIAYTGTISLDSELHSNMEKAAQWWTRVEEIISRCGTCNDTITNTGGCSQC